MLEKLWALLVELAVDGGIRLIGALALVVIGFKLTGWLNKLLINSKGMAKVDSSARSFISSFISIAFKIVIVFTAAAILGVPMTNMIAVLGSAGVAIGLALQGSLSNLAGGLMILIFQPFRVGDYVESAAAGAVGGTVQAINIFYTTLLTPDNRTVTVPNGTLSNNTVVNYSMQETRRVDLTFSVGYGSDAETVRSLLLGIAQNHELVLQDPEPVAVMSAHGDSAIQFALRVWCKKDDYWTVNFDLTEAAKRVFDENHVEIPFPQMDVHVKQ